MEQNFNFTPWNSVPLIGLLAVNFGRCKGEVELTIGDNWDPGPADIAAKQAKRIKPHLQEALYEVEQAVEGLTRGGFF